MSTSYQFRNSPNWYRYSPNWYRYLAWYSHASGGIISGNLHQSSTVPRHGNTGMDGFAGKDSRELPEPGLAMGVVRGVRMWSVLNNAEPKDSIGLPVIPDRRAILMGATGRYAWARGENTASCNLDNFHLPPENGCGCGFWAYWEWDGFYHVKPETAPVLGVIEGYGRVFTGTKGFRCEKARLIALAPVFTFGNARAERYGIELKERKWMIRFRGWLSRSYDVRVYDTHRLMTAQHKTGEITV